VVGGQWKGAVAIACWWVALQPAQILAAPGQNGPFRSFWTRGQGWGRACDVTQSVQLRGPTMEYLEKVRSQFLSLRHPPERSGFCVNEQAEKPRAKVGFSRIMAVPEIGHFWHNWSGEGIFLQGFVLRRFSTV